VSSDETAERHTVPTAPRTLVVGLGNPIRGDDGVGCRVADAVREVVSPTDGVEVDSLAVGGLRLMERLIGYDRVVVIDAVATESMPMGGVRALPLEAFGEASGGHVISGHDTSLGTAIALARRLGADLPREITIVGIEASPDFTFSETLSATMERAVPRAVELVLDLVRESHRGGARGIA
jgi:hydrogenase maturation protease